MAGQIIPRGDRTWLVRVYLGRDPETGKRRYHNHTVHGTKKDAQRYLNGVLREKDMGTFVEPSAVSLNEYLKQWLESAAKHSVRERTYEGYCKILDRYVRPTLGSRRLSEISPLDIQALYTSLRKLNLSARTIRYAHAVLRSALKQAVKWRMLAQNPADFVDLPRQAKKEMHALSPEEADRFLKAAACDRWGIIFSLAIATGMRPGEYLGLQWKDVDLRAGTITVQRVLVRVKGGWRFTEPKTSRSRRTIPLPTSLVRALSEYKHEQAAQIIAAGSTYQRLDLVFANRVGAPLDENNLVKRHFKPIVKAAALPTSLRLYDLRHSCATLLLAAGENPKVVSERLGHASITLTLDTYSHVLPTMQQGAAEKLEAMLFSVP
ncbi:putative prophage phiRv2 integrase [compost metagenome]